MSDFTIYHNPRCSKSRAALALLEERGVDFDIVEYLERPLTRPELDQLQRRLGLPPAQWVRAKEGAYAAAGL